MSCSCLNWVKGCADAMEGKDTFLKLIPGPPDWTIPWAQLGESCIGFWLSQMAQIQQNPAYHGEGDVFAHTRLVCEALAGLGEFRALDEDKRQAVFLAALLHDIGKIRCTRLEDGRWTSPHHAAAGAAMARELLWQGCGWCGDPCRQALRETVCTLIRYHALPPHAALEEGGIRRLLKTAAMGELLPGFSIELLCLLAKADILGRICGDREELLEAVELCGVLAKEQGCLTGPGAFPSEHTAYSYFSGRLELPDYELYDDSWGEVILMCGLPGTGKDTWIASHCPECPVVSLDAIRAELGISPMGPQKRVADEARARAKALLRAKRPFVWNATNVTADLRRGLVELFTAYRASVRIVYLETEWEEERRRNANRPAAVPETAILRMLTKLTPPERFEAHRVEWRCV